jgi:Fe-Mn family superoxide dismutase
LQHDTYYKENGVPEFMSPEAFDFSWTQYQTLLVNKLNLLTQGEPDTPTLWNDTLVEFGPNRWIERYATLEDGSDIQIQ